MSVTFGEEDAVAIDHLIQQIGRPVGSRRTASGSELTRSIMAKSNRRGAPRVNLVASDVTLQVENHVVNAVDFSLHGVQFRSTMRVAPGNSIVMNIRWRQEAASMALGRVMWATFEKPGKLVEAHYRVGVSFESSDMRTIRTILDRCGLGRSFDVQVVQSRW